VTSTPSTLPRTIVGAALLWSVLGLAYNGERSSEIHVAGFCVLGLVALLYGRSITIQVVERDLPRIAQRTSKYPLDTLLWLLVGAIIVLAMPFGAA